MKIDKHLAAKGGDARETRSEKAIRLLMALEGDPKRQKMQEFEPFYPAVLHAIARKVPRKTILKHLSEGGLKLYPALFEELLKSMSSEYKRRGDALLCNQCNQPLQFSAVPDCAQDRDKEPPSLEGATSQAAVEAEA